MFWSVWGNISCWTNRQIDADNNTFSCWHREAVESEWIYLCWYCLISSQCVLLKFVGPKTFESKYRNRSVCQYIILKCYGMWHSVKFLEGKFNLWAIMQYIAVKNVCSILNTFPLRNPLLLASGRLSKAQNFKGICLYPSFRLIHLPCDICPCDSPLWYLSQSED